MSSNTVYILHKQGADSHYVGLDFLLRENDYVLKYREFSVLSNMIKSVKSLNGGKFLKQCENLIFLINLAFSKNKKIVLGIAPFDYKLGIMLKLLRNHRIFYHTSWACWDKTFHPKKKKNSPKVFRTWKHFLETKSEHIFCVTKKSKDQILENYLIDANKINVVYHALNPVFSEKLNVKKKEKSFIYYGRMVPQKGIEELLNFFAENKEGSLTLVGDGNQRSLIARFADAHDNIIYKSEIRDKQELLRILAQHQYLVLNARWEELFSLVIIESMSQGVIPIASMLTGPREIISPDNGILFKEGEIRKVLNKVLSSNDDKSDMAANGIKKSKEFLPRNIAEKWNQILN